MPDPGGVNNITNVGNTGGYTVGAQGAFNNTNGAEFWGGLTGSGNMQGGKGVFGLVPYNPWGGAFGPTGQGVQNSDLANAGALQQNPYAPNLGNDTAAQQQQSQLIQMLMNQANGTGPSLAQQQLKQASDRNVQQTMAMMASQRGAGAGASAYQAANAGGQAGQQMAADSATLRLQEQMQAQQALGGVLNNARQGDQGAANLGMQGQQMTNQMVQFYLSQGMDIANANRQALIDQQKLNEASYYGNAPPSASVGGAAQGGSSFLGGALTTAAAA
jgi:hypothetical protein